MGQNIFPSDYDAFLQSIKTCIHQAQVKAVISVNRELIFLYWSIGHEIWKRQKAQGWGTKVIEQLSHDLRHEFSQMKGFSPRNAIHANICRGLS